MIEVEDDGGAEVMRNGVIEVVVDGEVEVGPVPAKSTARRNPETELVKINI